MAASTWRGRLPFMGAAALGLAAVAVLLGLWLAAHAQAGRVWLGAPLAEAVAARLAPTATEANFLAAAYQPRHALSGWHIVSAHAENAHPLWPSLFDDDPTYGLTVSVDVEYANGQRARLSWTTWRYGLVLGPVVLTYGSGPAAELTRLAAP